MQPDRHHLRRGFSFAVEHVERILQVVEESLARREPRRDRELHVVVVERVRDDEMRLPADPRPVRQVVVVCVGVVQEAALLDDQPPRVDRRRIAAVPPVRARPGGPLDRLDGAPHLRALLVLGHVLEADPPPAVRAGLVPRPLDRPPDGRVALDRHRAGEEGHLQLVLVEEAQEPPDPGPAPVLVDGLDDQVALPRADRRPGDLGEVHLRGLVAVADRILRAFLVVHHDLHGEPRRARPFGIRRASTVAGKVTRMRLHREGQDRSPSRGSSRRGPRSLAWQNDLEYGMLGL